MRRRLAALLLAGTALAAGLATAAPASATAHSAPIAAHSAVTRHAPAPHLNAVTFAGTVALSNCSGSLVRMPNSVSSDPALVLSNGHCLSTGFLNPGQVVLNQSSSRSFSLLNSSGRSVGTLRATKVAYATMTDTDISLYQLSTTYAQIQQQYGIQALTISASHPVAGTPITVVSGYWVATYSCSIDGFVYQLREDVWTWKDSVRYTSACQTIPGTSGSPVINNSTGQIVAVNNTGNEDGETCTLDNPCEVDQNGNVTVHQGTNYAEETYLIPACVTTGNRIDLTLPGCALPKP
jgi:V8-like Glu-specific endopeptidase